MANCRPSRIQSACPRLTACRGAAPPLRSPLGRFPGGRALYDPRPGGPRTPGSGVSCRFCYSGDTPSPRARRPRPRQVPGCAIGRSRRGRTSTRAGCHRRGTPSRGPP
ncbi:hypothetical protein C3492_43195 [Streptomyces sp. Ru62]|nr:hypothetical protein C3492_43195 [Streptomyces sp. Ru62]